MNGPSSGALGGVRTLMVGMAFLMVGNGLQGAVLGVRAEIEGFGFAVTGIVMAGYFAGFLFGTAVAERFLVAVGHIRVFAALASTASSAAILHAVWVNPVTWVLLRLVFGMCVAGLYVVVESWLNDMATNQNRGRILAGYMVVMMGGLGAGQLLLATGDPAGFQLFVLVSVLVSLALVPVTLSATSAPALVVPEAMPLRRLVTTIPTGAVAAFWSGAAHGTLLGLVAAYAKSEGLSDGRIAVLTAAAPLGCVVFQWPIGWLSDRVSRRAVIGLAALAAMASAGGALLVEPGSTMSLVLMFLFGGATFPIHSLAVAITVDWVAPNQITAATATLVRVTGVGAAICPIVAGVVMSATGPAAFYVTLVAVHGVIAVFVAYRIFALPAIPVDDQVDYCTLPARATAVTANLHPVLDTIDFPTVPDPDEPPEPSPPEPADTIPRPGIPDDPQISEPPTPDTIR